MTTIRRPTHPLPPDLLAQQAQQSQNAKVAAPAAQAIDLEGAPLSGEYQALNATGLPPPSPPLAATTEAMTTGAEAFGNLLLDMGQCSASSEAMMLAFLKLQILSSSQANRAQMLWGAGRSALYSNAIDVQKGKDQRAAQAAAAQTEAQNLEAQGDTQAEKGHEIVSAAGVDPAEVERLTEQSIKEGKDGQDVVERYAAAHKGEPGLQEKLDALREAEPYYQAAGVKYDQAEDKYNFAANISGGWMLGAATTLMTRAGTQGMQALLANAEAQRQILNELMALLSGLRPDARAKDEAIKEMDEFRNEVAALTLELIDSHAAVQGSKLQPFRS